MDFVHVCCFMQVTKSVFGSAAGIVPVRADGDCSIGVIGGVIRLFPDVCNEAFGSNPDCKKIRDVLVEGMADYKKALVAQRPDLYECATGSVGRSEAECIATPR